MLYDGFLKKQFNFFQPFKKRLIQNAAKGGVKDYLCLIESAFGGVKDYLCLIESAFGGVQDYLSEC
jgi:hypothetical protein